MRNTLEDPLPGSLLPPTEGRSGWPWAVEKGCLEPLAPSDCKLPRITIVIPSYNQGRFIEETIRSILLQRYPDLELLVIDGGSSDSTVLVLEKYAPWISYWVSEPDRGQSHAINKGFMRGTGELLAWVNSDDLLNPGALMQVSRYFLSNRDAGIIYGHHGYIDEQGNRTSGIRVEPFTLNALLNERHRPNLFHVPFIQSNAVQLIGFLDEGLHYAMDYEYACRLASNEFQAGVVDFEISVFRCHEGSKTVSVSSLNNFGEEARICRKYGGPALSLAFRTYWRIKARKFLERGSLKPLLSLYRRIKRAGSAL